MSFDNRDEFVNAQASEKIVLAHVYAKSRIYTWSVYSGNTYSRQLDYFLVDLYENLTQVTQVSSLGAVVADTFYFDVTSSTVYLNLNGVNPKNVDMIATYKLFYSNAPCTLSHDLTNTGEHVYYDARIEESPGFKHKIGSSQKLVSVISEGDLKLENNDGGMDAIYDTLIFENQKVEIFSWNRELQFSSAKRIYRGKVSNKRFNTDKVTLTIKDGIYDLLQDVPIQAFTDLDNVSKNVVGKYKRWVYGRVDGLHLQSTDQISDGYSITGTISGFNNGEWDASTNIPILNDSTGNAGENYLISATGTIDLGSGAITFTDGEYAYHDGSVWATYQDPVYIGSGTSFFSEVTPDDLIEVGNQEFNIKNIISDTKLSPSSETEYGFTIESMILIPDRPTVNKNRDFFVTGHAGAELTKTVVSIVQFNRIQVNNLDSLEVGDFIEFDSGERIEIKALAPNNIIVLRTNVIILPTIGSDVIRQPIQELFIEKNKVPSSSYTISNSSTELSLTLDDDVELNIATLRGVAVGATFTLNSRQVSIIDIDATTIIGPGMWIRPDNSAYTTLYEVILVEETVIYLRNVFAGATISASGIKHKSPVIIGDQTKVTANVLGRTVDNTTNGEFINDGAKAMKDLLSHANITDIETTSFDNPSNTETISITIPSNKSGGKMSVKEVIDKIAKSTYQVLTLDNNLDLKLSTMIPYIPNDAITIHDRDVVSWSISSVNGDLIKNSLIKYKHRDIDRYTQEAANSIEEYTSDFVEKYIGTNITEEKEVFVYDKKTAEIISHREIYLRSLSRAQLRVRTDLRLENVEIGDVVLIDFERLYKRFGHNSSRLKACLVTGRNITGTKMELFMDDLGNTMNRSSIITPNTANSYSTASDEEKLKYGYITDSNGLVNDEEDTQNTHLIT